MHQIDKQEFGRFVSQLRKEKGLTQKDLASILVISDKAISKWETGVSIPDVGMLIPLSETLGVTVTELLQCQRNPSPEPMESEAVEDLLKTAIAYSDEEQKINRPDWKQELPKFLLYAIGSGVSTLAVAAMCADSPLLNNLFFMEIMMVCFGAYFMMVLQKKLPSYYDQNQIRYFNDGFLKMNLPGLTFNNRNWPYIRQAGVRSCVVIGLVYPWIFLFSEKCIPQEIIPLKLMFMLVPILGGLILPMYIAGKKHS